MWGNQEETKLGKYKIEINDWRQDGDGPSDTYPFGIDVRYHELQEKLSQVEQPMDLVKRVARVVPRAMKIGEAIAAKLEENGYSASPVVNIDETNPFDGGGSRYVRIRFQPLDIADMKTVDFVSVAADVKRLCTEVEKELPETRRARKEVDEKNMAIMIKTILPATVPDAEALATKIAAQLKLHYNIKPKERGL